MIKILQIGLGPYPGGMENCIMNYYCYINKRKFSFDFVDQYGKGLAYAEEIKALGGKIYSIGNFKKHPLSASRKLKNIIEENDYDIVHINMLSAANMLPVDVACSVRQRPVVVVHSHNSNLPTGPVRCFLHYFNKKRLQNKKIKKWACSVCAGEWMWGRSFVKGNVIPNAIDTRKFSLNICEREKIRRDFCIDKHDVVIGFVGRLCEQKNVLFLPDILKELNKISPKFKLLIVGDGKLRSKLEKKIKLLGIEEYVTLVGACNNTAPYYSAMDIFLLPSLFEGLPVVGIEAQACGLQCLVSDKVTKELGNTEKILYLPITMGAKVWANSIVECERKLEDRICAVPLKYELNRAVRDLEIKYEYICKTKMLKGRK